MDNQHKKITGYRDLSQSEIDLMNRIKAHGEQTKTLLDDIATIRHESREPFLGQDSLDETFRCIELARDNFQTGQMWLVRAVALPQSF